MPLNEWTSNGLVDHFAKIHRTMGDRRFAFLIGAGASIQSGIPTATALAKRWVSELHKRNPEGRTLAVESWATPGRLGINGFDYSRIAEWYPQIFTRRFQHDSAEGFADLEEVMQAREPSYGYSVLAQILATRHRTVITTNFDNLVAEALAIYGAVQPFICGHELLAPFIKANLRRPIIIKVHRDLLLAPRNTLDEVSTLEQPWISPLSEVMRSSTLLVIGYGGNDGSLMNFLHSLAPGGIPGGIFWCYYEKGGRPNASICELVSKHPGAIIPIDGFDEFMAMLSAGLELGGIADVVEDRTHARLRQYRQRVEELMQRVDSAAESGVSPDEEPVAFALQQIYKQLTSKDDDWWSWKLRAQGERNLERKIQLYRAARARFPHAADLASSFAWVLTDQSPELWTEARATYEQALELYRRDPNTYLGLAVLHALQGNLDESWSATESALYAAATGGGEDWIGTAVAFLRGILYRLSDRDDDHAIGVLQAIFVPATSFVETLGHALERLIERIHEPSKMLYRLLLRAMLEEQIPAELKNHPRWRDGEPIMPLEPWPEFQPLPELE
jgi:tetratricopeptide (TPR) repeat protein